MVGVSPAVRGHSLSSPLARHASHSVTHRWHEPLDPPHTHTAACRATPLDSASSSSRESSHSLASCSSPPAHSNRRRAALAPLQAAASVKPLSSLRGRASVVPHALFDPPLFTPAKLTTTFAVSTTAVTAEGAPTLPASRCYTLTHNDISGDLTLTVGDGYNLAQISGMYTRLLRDEVRAEWRQTDASSAGLPASAGVSSLELHVFCHVSGEERWLASPTLRNYIFRRELPLVLDAISYADRHLLDSHPDLRQADVIVHFQSNVQELRCVEWWGVLGDRSSWQRVPTSITLRLLRAFVGLPGEPAAHVKVGVRVRPVRATSAWTGPAARVTVDDPHAAAAAEARAVSAAFGAAAGVFSGAFSSGTAGGSPASPSSPSAAHTAEHAAGGAAPAGAASAAGTGARNSSGASAPCRTASSSPGSAHGSVAAPWSGLDAAHSGSASFSERALLARGGGTTSTLPRTAAAAASSANLPAEGSLAVEVSVTVELHGNISSSSGSSGSSSFAERNSRGEASGRVELIAAPTSPSSSSSSGSGSTVQPVEPPRLTVQDDFLATELLQVRGLLEAGGSVWRAAHGSGSDGEAGPPRVAVYQPVVALGMQVRQEVPRRVIR